MKERTISSYQVRKTIAKILSVTGEVVFMIEQLDHEFGYGATYRKYHRIMCGFVDQKELIRQSPNRYRLTKKGTIRLLPMIKPHLSKDGMIRILVFDIPEDRKLSRNRFRNHIRMLGFQMHQKSVWISRYDCEKWLLRIVDYYEVGDCVSLYVGEHIW